MGVLDRLNRANTNRPRRLLIDVWGQQKLGKTHFALTAPEPIVFFNFDLGLEELMPKFAGKEIYPVDLFAGIDTSLETAKALYNKFLSTYVDVLKEVKKGTVVIDSGTQLWQLIQKVDLEEIKASRKNGNIYPFDYANSNVHFANIINAVKMSPLNFIITHRSREKYNEGGQPSGKWEEQGNSQVPYLVQTVIKLFDDRSTVPPTWYATIESSRDNPNIEGVSVPRDQMDFDFLLSLVLPDQAAA